MQEASNSQVQIGLKTILADATRALACLNADRLEELAASCRALQRGLLIPNLSPDLNPDDKGRRLDRGVLAHPSPARQSREALSELAAFAGVLQATRANLDVMHRLQARGREGLEYEVCGVHRSVTLKETGHGDN
jgi:hypothetical protein